MMRGRTRENQGDINNLLGMDKLDFKLESNLDIYSVLQKFGINTPNYITIQTGSGRCWENIKNEEVFQKPEPIVWECANCGFSYIGEKAIDTCPVCKHPQSYFFEKANNY